MYTVVDLGDLNVPFHTKEQCLSYIKKHILRLMEKFLPDKEYINTFSIKKDNDLIWSKTINVYHGDIFSADK